MKLIIAEKPIAAKRIANILGLAKQKKMGSIDVFELLNGDVVVPLKGHAVNVDFPKELNNWQKTKLSDLIDGKIEYIPSLRGIKKVIHSFAKAKELIIATDYDREGESIGREAIEIVKQKNSKIKVKRAKFSSLVSSEVKKAFSHLADFDYNLADAADSRREIDLIWGAVLTRYVSLTSGKLGRNFLSVGRVQTPTLALIVDKEKEIKAFKPKDYWMLSIECEKGKDKFNAVYKTEKLFDKAKAEELKKLFSKTASVEKIEEKVLKQKPPVPFNTTEFLRAASSIGLQPKRAMSVAEKLYMAGLVSYPRTDNTYYPESLDLREILKKFKTTKEFGELASKLLAKKKLTPTSGKKKTTDHPPIHPVELANKKALQPVEWKVYELIVRRFLATLADEAKLKTVKATLDYSGENFIAKGKTIVEKGWKEFYTYSKSEEQFLPKLQQGEKLKASEVKSEQKQTKPKSRYTPAGLIKLMDDNNLGTKATRAEILQKLIDRGYVQGKQNFTPSQIAFAVIDALEKYGEDIAKPKMTSDLEKEMDEVEQGKKKKKEVIEESRKMLHKVLNKLEKNKEKVSQDLRQASNNDYIVGKCPKCGGDLRILRSRRTKKQFVGCSNYNNGCSNSYPLPQKAKIVPTGRICDKCGTPIVRIIRAKMRPFEMCLDMNCPTKAEWRKKSKYKPKEKESSAKPAVSKKAGKKETKPKVKKPKTVRKTRKTKTSKKAVK